MTVAVLEGLSSVYDNDDDESMTAVYYSLLTTHILQQ